MSAFFNFLSDMMKLEPKWLVWLICLIGANVGGGIIFFDTLEGQMAIAFTVIGTAIMSYIHARYGVVRLLSLGHVLWLYLIPHFYMTYLSLKPSHFKGWLFMVVALNFISLVIDIFELIKYYRGDKESLLEHKEEDANK